MDSRVLRCNHLIKKIQKGNEKALEDLFKEFGSLFLNMAKKYLFDKSYAEDLVSEVFVELVRTSARSFDSRQNGLNWIFTIIRRKAFKHNGNLKEEIPISETENQRFLVRYMVIDENPQSEKAMDVFLLKQGMEKLSQEENTILYYKFWEGLTVREIAKKLGKPRSTIQYKIDETLKKLKKYCDFGE